MFAATIIVFREILEIALILGVVAAATRGLDGRKRWISIGIGAGVLGSLTVAYFAGAISQAAQGMGQEIFNAIILFTATLLIGWTVLWMSTHAKQLTAHLRNVSQKISDGQLPMYSLAVVIALAVLREGAEIVLFTHGMIAAGQPVSDIATGGLLGLAGGAIVGGLLYVGLIQISPKHIFSVTTWLLAFVAAGMASVGAKYLVAADILPYWTHTLWDSSAILSEQGFVGQMLHALIGYSAQPMGIQLAFYVATLAILFIAMRLLGQKRIKSKSATTALACITLALTSFTPDVALATKTVSKPYVKKDKLKVAWRYGHDVDDDAAKDNKEAQRLEFGYGITHFWSSEIDTNIKKSAGFQRDYKLTSIAWDNTFQLTEKGKYFVDVGLKATYEVSLKDNQADEINLKLLLAKHIGTTSHYANITASEELGEHADGGITPGFAWSSSYNLSPYFKPGFEYHANLGRVNQNKDFSEQSHVLGPVAYGSLPYNVSYDAGYLFGISGAAQEGLAKLILKYSVSF